MQPFDYFGAMLKFALILHLFDKGSAIPPYVVAVVFRVHIFTTLAKFLESFTVDTPDVTN